MMTLIMHNIENCPRKKLAVGDLISSLKKELGEADFWEEGGYLAVVKNLEVLEQQEIIKGVKRSGLNGLTPPIYNSYVIKRKRENLSPNQAQGLITQFHPRIKLDFYFRNPQVLQEDTSYLIKLDQYLRANSKKDRIPPATINERSYQIFQDEKFLSSSRGIKFLRRVGFTLEGLNCFVTEEPFFYFKGPKSFPEKHINVLIIENRDTFFSFQSSLKEKQNLWGDKRIHLIIYGEGKKICKSFKHVWDLEDLQGTRPTFYYFGDLDSEGITIWYQLKQSTGINVLPDTFLYKQLLLRSFNKATLIRTKQSRNPISEKAFLEFFSMEDRKLLEYLLASNRYIPQEALSLQDIKKLALDLDLRRA